MAMVSSRDRPREGARGAQMPSGEAAGLALGLVGEPTAPARGPHDGAQRVVLRRGVQNHTRLVGAHRGFDCPFIPASFPAEVGGWMRTKSPSAMAAVLGPPAAEGFCCGLPGLDFLSPPLGGADWI